MKKKLLLCSLGLFLFGLALYFSARWIPGFADFYTSHIYLVTAGIFSYAFSVLPFSGAELLLYALLLFLVFYPFYLIIKARREKQPHKMKYCAALYFSKVTFLLSLLLFLYFAHCGVNYYRTGFAASYGFTGTSYTGAELADYCSYLTDQLNELSAVIPKDEKGSCASSKSFYRVGSKTMSLLGEKYSSLSGRYPLAKPVAVSQILSWQQLCGIYSPFTVEANINKDMPGFYIPFTICHELSHLKGYMQEEEANFISYLACTGSDNVIFQYSGYLVGYVYAMNELYQYDRTAYALLRGSLCKTADLDLQENSRFWHEYEGKIAQVSSRINDSYLKANSQADGIESYDRMVGLQIAYYRTLKNSNSRK